MTARLANKIAIVTGGAHGLGAEQVRLFAEQGATVVIADILEDQGKALVTELRATGRAAHMVRVDVTSQSDWRTLAAFVVETMGPPDILVNNAGISGMSVAHLEHEEAWNRLVAVNARGCYLGMTEIAPLMETAGRGSIVNIGSIIGLVGSRFGNLGYAASKAAVSAQTRAMAVRLGPSGVRVNTVNPGFFPEMLDMPNNARGDIAATIPLARIGRPREIANAVLFLASDESSYVTGIDLTVDGGFTAQ
ncbi:MAG TPA: glucose 1-dehydrogenase [Devosia sp.]|nr:glucose 1-dehydrogenase [Devosia sp.]